MVVAPAKLRAGVDGDTTNAARLERHLSIRGVVLWLIGIAALSTALRIALVAEVHGPFVFPDELGYERLAHSLGQSGQVALFNREGLSYSPLYSAVLAPIFALGASAPVAYDWIKVINAILMSLSIFPLYKIARFVLPRGPSLVAAGLSAVAPLMYYTALAMSENLAYPSFLVSVWAMLVCVRSPSRRTDALLLFSIVLASTARIQSIALFPAALTAVALAAVFGPARAGHGLARSLTRACRQHWLLLGSAALLLMAAGIRALAGQGVLSIAGRYSNVGESGLPNPWRVLVVAVQNLAGMDIALGVIPFVGALAAAYAFFRSGSRREYFVFAAVACSVIAWMLLEVGVNGALFPNGPRMHERYLFYVAPLFLVALVAAFRLPAAKASFRAYLGAATLSLLLPVVIPFGTVIDNAIVTESFGLQLFGREVGATIVPISHATIAAVCVAGTLGLTYVLIRNRTRAVIVFVLLVFVVMSGLVRSRIIRAATGATASVLPEHHDWVDRTKPRGDVVLVVGPGASQLAAGETAFNNLSITRIYYTCDFVFGNEFGEQRIFVDRAGRLRDARGYVTAAYAVVPAGSGIRGRVIASNTRGRQILVAPEAERLAVSRAQRDRLSCET